MIKGEVYNTGVEYEDSLLESLKEEEEKSETRKSHKSNTSNNVNEKSILVPTIRILSARFVKEIRINIPTAIALMPLKGLRTGNAQLTKQKKSLKCVSNKPNASGVMNEILLSSATSRIRQALEDQETIGTGAARADAIIGDYILLKGVLDPGSHSSFVSKRLASELNWEILSVSKKEAKSNCG
ncbi:hypothetical protein BCV72DRAFT_308047 [Rhizopus microsporus var. microsporus]|uniref:Uncharacterized protein n=2 Tax=Rhizopus microsporus TaxID=58291 RepID=A0A2G4SI61_RHIZD|nr:uncharacterized protein RHIMIDRAFT_241488 [Rhizopus microsporus ATCC 52813]ORE03602.1 hypothetical protein BCV72DRAFT_308047 [Rhizopus microsporus var. microsporus]PHZ08468.1 hypothetical protein RHIMIDRAFT_241488 [Rhizopus microsporus ATCC 52813]